MAALVKSGFRNQAYTLLRERILNQHYRFGERLNIDILSREMSISNNPIREALTMLEKDGLITMTPNVGSKVIEFTAELFRELTQTIELLIAGAYQICIDEGRMDALIERMEEALAAQHQAQNSDREFAMAAIRFDESFVKVTRNQRLIDLFDSQMDIFQMALLYDYQTRDIDKKANLVEHEEILLAAKQGDHKLVRQVINRHYAREIAFPQK